MGIRTAINEKPMLAGAIAGAVVVLALISIVLWSARSQRVVHEPMRFYSADDGKSWFADSYTRVPPFDHRGREAVIAHVYTDGQSTFVGFLEKFTNEARDKVEAAGDGDARMDVIERLPPGSLLVKRPGDASWTADPSPQAAAIRRVVSPNGAPVRVVTP